MNETHPSIEQIVDYLHGELPTGEDAAVHAHLAGCRNCEDLRSDEASLTELLRTHAQAQERELPPGVVARIHLAARERRPSSWERLRAALRPVVLIPVAVAAALVIYLGVGKWRATTTPTPIDATAYVDTHSVMASTTPFAEEAPPTALTSDDETR
jgi:predicted anti-sigma-YlaC factor YlaD